MSEWKKVKFLDVVSLNPRVKLEKGAEYAFVEMSNASETSRNPQENVTAIYKGGGAKFEYGDTVIARIEPCLQNGKAFFCQYEMGFGSTEFLVFRPLSEELMDKVFLYYYMRQDRIREAMAKTMVGASGRQRVNNSIFNSLEIPLPSLTTQHRIATILSRYDSLIENYQKQIKLLEEAAQRLYKEWFVDLRFPGHENTTIIDGVPEGWEVVTLNDVTSKITTGLNPRKNFVLGNGNNYYVTIKNMANNTIYLDDKCDKVDDDALEKINKRSDLETGDILFSGIGTIGRVCLIDIPTNNWNVSESVFTLRAKDIVSKEFMYLMLLGTDIQNYCQAHAHGAAQKGIRMADLKAYKFSLAPRKIMQDFKRKVAPYINNVSRIQSQLRLLTEARDRLLPKLMSGEIEV